jgi:RNA polymerase sigma-70 factor (ECF subfamily)
MKFTTDSLIVEEVLSGNKEAYGHLVDRYKRPLYNLAFRMTSSVEDARDLSQEAFVRAYTKLHKYRPDKSLFTWLYTICLNLTRNHLAKRREVSSEDPNRSAVARGMSDRDCESLPDDLLIEREETKWLERALQLIPVDLREAVVLRYMQDLPFEEVATISGISTSAAKMRVYRGLERLRELRAREEQTDGR